MQAANSQTEVWDDCESKGGLNKRGTTELWPHQVWNVSPP